MAIEFEKMDPEDALDMFKPFNGFVNTTMVQRLLIAMMSADPKTKRAYNDDLNSLYMRCCQRTVEGSNVFLPIPAERQRGEVSIGTVFQGRREYGEYLMLISSMAHFLALGANGTGKSTTFWRIQKKMIEMGLSVLVFDRKQDIRHMLNQLPFAVVEANQLRINPFMSPDENIDQTVWISKVCDLFKIWLYDAGINYIKEYLTGLYIKKGRAPNFYDLYNAMKSTTEKGDVRSGYQASALNKIRGLVEELGGCFNCQEGYPLTEMIKRPLCIEVDELNSQSERFFINLVLLTLFEVRKARSIRGDPAMDRESLFVFIDEAAPLFYEQQQFSEHTKAMGFDVMQEIATKCRDMKMCLFLGSQVPLIDTMMNNVKAKAVFNLPDAKIAKDMAASVGVEQRLFGRLRRGEFVMKVEGVDAFGVRTTPLERRVISKDVFEEMNRPFAEFIVKQSIPITEEEEKEEDKKGLSKDARRMLLNVCAKPSSSISSRYKELGLKGDKAQKVVEELVNGKYADLVSLSIDGRPLKFLVVLKAGIEWLRDQKKPVNHLTFIGNVSSEHLLIQVLVSFYLRAQGRNVFHDWPVNSKLVDIYCDGVVYEVCINPTFNVERVKSTLSSIKGYIFLCLDTDILNKVKENARPLPPEKLDFQIASRFIADLRKSTLDYTIQNDENDTERHESSQNGQTEPRTGSSEADT